MQRGSPGAADPVDEAPEALEPAPVEVVVPASPAPAVAVRAHSPHLDRRVHAVAMACEQTGKALQRRSWGRSFAVAMETPVEDRRYGREGAVVDRGRVAEPGRALRQRREPGI